MTLSSKLTFKVLFSLIMMVFLTNSSAKENSNQGEIFPLIKTCDCIFFVDIDNTLFKNGEPIIEMVNKVREMQHNGEDIFFLSGRQYAKHIEAQIKEWFVGAKIDPKNMIFKNKSNMLIAQFKFELMNSMFKKGKGIVLIDDNIKNINYAQKEFAKSKINFQPILVNANNNYKETVGKIEEVKVVFR